MGAGWVGLWRGGGQSTQDKLRKGYSSGGEAERHTFPIEMITIMVIEQDR